MVHSLLGQTGFIDKYTGSYNISTLHIHSPHPKRKVYIQYTAQTEGVRLRIVESSIVDQDDWVDTFLTSRSFWFETSYSLPFNTSNDVIISINLAKQIPSEV